MSRKKRKNKERRAELKLKKNAKKKSDVERELDPERIAAEQQKFEQEAVAKDIPDYVEKEVEDEPKIPFLPATGMMDTKVEPLREVEPMPEKIESMPRIRIPDEMDIQIMKANFLREAPNEKRSGI